METKVVTVENVLLFESAVAEASRLLKDRQVVALPTETVYGLAANALDNNAVEKIYEVKGRPSHNPIIVHVASLAMAHECVKEWPAAAETLARNFWPGPLTIVLPRSEKIPPIVTAGGGTVGVRLPLHPFIRKTIEQCGFPLAAPSANKSNELSPTTARHVVESLGGKIPLVVDAGPTSVGIESTVVDLTSSTPTVLRPGMISAEQIGRVLGKAVTVAINSSGELLKSPGRLQKHYSPRARLVLGSWENDSKLHELAAHYQTNFAEIHVVAYDRIPQANPFGRVAIIPNDPEAYARAIYAELHQSDELGAKLILVEMPPQSSDWDGIRDRLTRASA